MLNHQTIIKVNRQSANPLVIQAVFYDLDEQTGFILNKKLHKFECICKFCLGYADRIEADHFIQAFPKK